MVGFIASLLQEESLPSLTIGVSLMGFPGAASGKEAACHGEDVRDAGSIPSSGKPLEEGMATHSSILAQRIPWTEEPGGLQSIGSQSRTRLKRLSTAQH